MFSRFHMTLETSEFGSGCICGDPIQLDTSILLYIHATQGTYNSKNCYRRRVKFILEGQDSPLFFYSFPWYPLLSVSAPLWVHVSQRSKNQNFSKKWRWGRGPEEGAGRKGTKKLLKYMIRPCSDHPRRWAAPSFSRRPIFQIRSRWIGGVFGWKILTIKEYIYIVGALFYRWAEPEGANRSTREYES